MSIELGRTLFSARSRAEYRAMFALTDDDLAGCLTAPAGRPASPPKCAPLADLPPQ
jgi:hypothetical protein